MRWGDCSAGRCCAAPGRAAGGGGKEGRGPAQPDSTAEARCVFKVGLVVQCMAQPEACLCTTPCHLIAARTPLPPCLWPPTPTKGRRCCFPLCLQYGRVCFCMLVAGLGTRAVGKALRGMRAVMEAAAQGGEMSFASWGQRCRQQAQQAQRAACMQPAAAVFAPVAADRRRRP